MELVERVETVETGAVVIGGGPGGYVCAIRLGQLGVPTALVEQGELGGVCLNVGCIPSKALISASKTYEGIESAGAMGIGVSGRTLDLGKMMAWKGGIVAKLTGGVSQLLEANGVRVIRGSARFGGPRSVEVERHEGGPLRVRFEHAVIATGSVPAEIPGFAIDGEHVLGSRHALALEELPEHMLVVGGGYIGMELGGVYQRLGAKVTVVEYEGSVLPGFDPELVRPVVRRFRRGGGELLTGMAARGWSARPGGGVSVEVAPVAGGEPRTLEADHVLLTVGREPRTAGLQLDRLGLEPDARGFLAVDGEQRTRLGHVFAIGDVAGEPMLAHKASKEGEVAAEVIAGRPAAFDTDAIPAVVFTDPEIATVGLDPAAAEARAVAVKVGRFPFAANGRALSLGVNHSDGFVRTVVDAGSGVLLGVQAVGPEVSNLIAEATLAIELGAQAEDVGLTIHAHPTLSEAVMEAANHALGHAVHTLNPKPGE